MPQSYSLDFRKTAIKAIENGENFSQVAKKLGVHHETIRRWYYMNLKGSLRDSKPKDRKPKKLNPTELKRYVDENPDKTIKQIADHFGVWYQAVYYRLSQMNYTYKKRLSLQGKKSK